MCGYKYEFILLRQPSIIAIILQLGCTRTFQRARAIECEDVKIRLTLQLNGGIYFEKFFLKTKKKNDYDGQVISGTGLIYFILYVFI